MPVLINNLTKKYADTVIFKDFCISLDDKVINCILGESGIGKTTLLNIIAGLDKDIKAEITGLEGATFSYIFQETRLLKWYNAYKNIEFVLRGLKLKEKEKHIRKYLKLVGLEEHMHLYPEQLSGGMKQRLSIARAFAFPSDILLMDEPFKGLDPTLKEDLFKEFLKVWEEDKRTVFFVSHDIDEVVLLGDNIHILGGRPAKEIFSLKIDVAKSERNLYDEAIVKNKKLIYSIFKDNKGVK